MFDSEFFPTPTIIIEKMLSKVSNKNAQYFLEPSAGKGDIAEYIKSTRYRQLTVDCIEQQPELCSILSDKGFPIVGYDWLTYDGVSYYDCILMNPPFSNGDKHLLKAWEFLHSGEIVCLLNEETIKNPYSEARKRLVDIIEKHGDVEYIGDCFSIAERKTGVNVAMVYLKKVQEDDSFDLWDKSKEEKDVNINFDDYNENSLAVIDTLGNMQHFYDKANEHMLKAFEHIRKAAVYMNANDVSIDQLDKIMSMACKNTMEARAEFLINHRKHAWIEVFKKMDFDKWLDKKQKEVFIRDINKHGNVPFTKENIKGTLHNVFMQREKLFEKSVANIFDELTRYYKENTNYTEGWKSNSNYKINNKIIFPYGCTFDDKYSQNFSLRYDSSTDIYRDLDKIICVLTGKKYENCLTIETALRNKFQELGNYVKAPFDNETESDFFNIKFYKKGTLHLTFKEKEHRDLLNKAASKGRMWLGNE